ncbi:MAG TPA: hypothetical protein VG892_07605 [Terriglobales bacterium]|nr:hypothetical protein [Terriglobales bacterium]
MKAPKTNILPPGIYVTLPEISRSGLVVTLDLKPLLELAKAYEGAQLSRERI